VLPVRLAFKDGSVSVVSQDLMDLLELMEQEDWLEILDLQDNKVDDCTYNGLECQCVHYLLITVVCNRSDSFCFFTMIKK